jgi:hypothetical protein
MRPCRSSLHCTTPLTALQRTTSDSERPADRWRPTGGLFVVAAWRRCIVAPTLDSPQCSAMQCNAATTRELRGLSAGPRASVRRAILHCCGNILRRTASSEALQPISWKTAMIDLETLRLDCPTLQGFVVGIRTVRVSTYSDQAGIVRVITIPESSPARTMT